MSPEFVITSSKRDDPETVTNKNVLTAKFFPQLQMENGVPVIPLQDLDFENGYLQADIGNYERVLIYPQEWFLTKKVVFDKEVYLLDTLCFQVFKTEEMDYIIKAQNTETEESESFCLISYGKRSNLYYYGKVQNYQDDRNYYENEEEYDRVKKFLEENTSLKIKDFHLSFKRTESTRRDSIVGRGEFEIFINLK